MAQRIITTITCDNHPEVEAFRTLTFSWDDKTQHHEVDLCESCAEALFTFTAKARRTTTKAPRLTAVPSAPARSARRDPEQTMAIRAWAKANGFELSSRGRIPGHVEDAYNRGNAVLTRLRAQA